MPDPKTDCIFRLIPVAPMVQTVLIESEGGEFLTCIDGSANKVIVAKPHLFRRSFSTGRPSMGWSTNTSEPITGRLLQRTTRRLWSFNSSRLHTTQGRQFRLSRRGMKYTLTTKRRR